MYLTHPLGSTSRGYVRSFPAYDPWRICQICQALSPMSGMKLRATTPICCCEKDVKAPWRVGDGSSWQVGVFGRKLYIFFANSRKSWKRWNLLDIHVDSQTVHVEIPPKKADFHGGFGRRASAACGICPRRRENRWVDAAETMIETLQPKKKRLGGK